MDTFAWFVLINKEAMVSTPQTTRTLLWCQAACQAYMPSKYYGFHDVASRFIVFHGRRRSVVKWRYLINALKTSQ